MTNETTGDQEAIPKKWLITGGCGFIGTSLIRYLGQTVPGVRIRVMDNLAVGGRRDLSKVCDFEELDMERIGRKMPETAWGKDVQLVVGDIKSYEDCASCARGVDVIVHLAANTGVAPSVEDPRSDMEANVIGIFNMLEASRTCGIRRFVFASSGAPVGEITPPIHEEMAPHPVSPYGASKLAGEGYCSAYYRTFGIETVALRFGNVYGPGSGHKNSVVAKFIKQAMRSETLEIYGDGTQTRDFIYIDDLSRAIVLAATRKDVGGETFQIATNSETTVSEMVGILQTRFRDAGLGDLNVIHGAPRIGDVKRNFSDTSKAAKSLGWMPEVALRDGIGKTIEWFQAGPD